MRKERLRWDWQHECSTHIAAGPDRWFSVLRADASTQGIHRKNLKKNRKPLKKDDTFSAFSLPCRESDPYFLFEAAKGAVSQTQEEYEQ